jgi:hypothetical protein
MTDAAKPGRFGMNQIIPIATALMAVVFIWLGLKTYGFWDPNQGPMPGFFPVLIAAAMLVASAVAFSFYVQRMRAADLAEGKLAGRAERALNIGSTFLIGLIPSIAAYVLIWLRGYEKCSWRRPWSPSRRSWRWSSAVSSSGWACPFPKA